MKATRSIVPVLVVLTVLVAAALAIGIMARGGQQEQQKAALVDNGPNARLSNEELVTRAISNTKAATGYHLDFTADLRVPDLGLRESLSMTADVRSRTEEGRFRVAYVREGPPNFPDTFLSYWTQMTATTEILSTGDAWYESYDGGKSWSKPADFTPAFVSTFFVCPLGGSTWLMCPTEAENLLENQTFKDGSPLLEEVDGLVLRHVVAEIETPVIDEQSSEQLYAWLAESRSVELWVSTDITPTIKQMKMGSVNETGTDARNDIVNDVVTGKSGQIYSLAFSPDGKMLAVAHGGRTDPTVRLWDLDRPGSPPLKFTNTEGGFNSVAFSPDGSLLAASSIASGRPNVYIWDLHKPNTEPVVLEAPPAILPAVTIPRTLFSVAFSPDGTMLVAGGSDYGAVLWQAPFGTKAPVTTSSQEFIGVRLESVVFSPDNNTMYGGNFDRGVFVLDVRHPNDDPTILPIEQLTGLAISPDGRWLAANGYSALKVWDLTQSPPRPLDLLVSAGEGTRLAFSPDSRFLAVGTQSWTSEGNVLRLWDVSQFDEMVGSQSATQTPAVELQLSEPFYAIAFSPDGKTLALAGSGKGEGVVHLWNMKELLKPGIAALPTPYDIRDMGKKAGDSSFTLTWKVSRFDEDFGEIKPPPTETIK